MLARLIMKTDPEKAFQCTEVAIKNGDVQAINLQSQILDSGHIKSPHNLISRHRLACVTEAVAIHDSVFASQYKLPEVRESGFMQFILGKK